LAEAARFDPEGCVEDGAGRAGLAGAWFHLRPEGALHWPDEDTLIVADLHLEKGSAHAARGIFLPPYDSAETLARLDRLCRGLAPKRIIALGDSFHDRAASSRIGGRERDLLAALQRGRDWLWIAGNHDPAPPAGLGGDFVEQVVIGSITFRHEPLAGAVQEVAGHLHPAAKVRVRGRSIRRRCFACSETRIVLPAFGAFTGSLNVLDTAFAGLFPDEFHAWMLGSARLHPVPRRKLLPDH
jgi:hypothetical protein